jgi:import inner membrane translocase subunit TIM21
MRLHFYVQASQPGSPQPLSDTSYFDSLAGWTRDRVSALSVLSLDDAIAWAKERVVDVQEKSKRLFRYLSGAPLSPPPPQFLPSSSQESVAPVKEELGAWSFAGMFSSIRGPRSKRSDPGPEESNRVWTEGEVHANLIRVG